MRTAAQRLHIESRPLQHPARDTGMPRRSRMRCTGKRDLGIAEPEPIRRPALDQRNGLQRLYRRPRKHQALDVAESDDDLAVRLRDRQRARMHAFHEPPARQLDENQIGHCRDLHCVMDGAIAAFAPTREAPASWQFREGRGSDEISAYVPKATWHERHHFPLPTVRGKRAQREGRPLAPSSAKLCSALT